MALKRSRVRLPPGPPFVCLKVTIRQPSLPAALACAMALGCSAAAFAGASLRSAFAVLATLALALILGSHLKSPFRCHVSMAAATLHAHRFFRKAIALSRVAGSSWRGAAPSPGGQPLPELPAPPGSRDRDVAGAHNPPAGRALPLSSPLDPSSGLRLFGGGNGDEVRIDGLQLGLGFRVQRCQVRSDFVPASHDLR